MPVQNIDDLRNEILRLEVLKQEQEIALKPRFSSPIALFHTAMTVFPKSSASSERLNLATFLNQDFIALASRVLLPLTLNKTLFKRSNFIIKALVGMLSQKASGLINEETVTGTWGKAKAIFSKMFKKGKAEAKTVVPEASVITPANPPYGDELTQTVIKQQEKSRNAE